MAMTMHLRGALSLLAATLTLCTARAQETATSADTMRRSFPEKVIGLAETVLSWVTIERNEWSLAIYPAASYSSRQGLAIGIMPTLQLRSGKLPRPMTITPSALVSTKKMFEVQCDADIYLPRATDITLKFETYKMPDDFYVPDGARKKTPTAQYDFFRRMLTAEFSKGLGASAWRLGALVDADHYRFTNIQNADSAALIRLHADKGSSYGLGLLTG